MLPPGVSMLWEDVDPAAALRDRFGFTGLTAVTDWLTALLRGSWDLDVGPCSRLVVSGENAVAWVSCAEGPLVVKFSRAGDRFARLDVTTAVLDHLARTGIPVAAPRPTTDGGFRVRAAGPAGELSTGVFPELPGDWLDVADTAAVHDAGTWLARTHAALADLPGDLVPARATGGLRKRVGAWLTDDDPGHVPAVSRRLAGLLASAPDLPGAPQVVHGDFRAANVLTRDHRVVAVLDLDDAHRAHPVEDLAQACTYLATRFRRWGPTSPAVRREFLAGYGAVRPLGAAERHWLDLLALWFGVCAVPGPGDAAGWADAVRHGER